MHKIEALLLAIILSCGLHAQVQDYEFGKGLRYTAKDSSFSIKFGFRFQTLFSNKWTVSGDNLGKIEENNSSIRIRRSRFKFDGYALTPKLQYKFELGLANQDISHSNPAMFGAGGNIVMDAYLKWNFYRGFSLQAGQGKLPGNRERVVSSANMQLVDRSLLNSYFNLDRDIGIALHHKGRIGQQFGTRLIAAVSQGEGRNVIAGNTGGYQYTFRGELLPFGDFHDKGDYVGSAIYREEKPKLSIGFTFDANMGASRTRGNLGSFMVSPHDNYKDLLTGFCDMMFKYQGFSFMGEYAIRRTSDGSPRLYDRDLNHLGTYYTGAGLNLQAGYMFRKQYEIAGRFGHIVPQNTVVGVQENEYVIGFSKYLKGHSLKVQTDCGYIQRADTDDAFFWRVQMDIHF